MFRVNIKDIIVVASFVLCFLPAQMVASEYFKSAQKRNIEEVEVRYEEGKTGNSISLVFRKDSTFLRFVFTGETPTWYCPFNRRVVLDKEFGEDLYNRIDSLFISRKSKVCEKNVQMDSGLLLYWPDYFYVNIIYLNGEEYKASYPLDGLFDKNSKSKNPNIFSQTFENLMSIMIKIARNNGLFDKNKKIVIKRKLKNGKIPSVIVPKNNEIIIKR